MDSQVMDSQVMDSQVMDSQVMEYVGIKCGHVDFWAI